MIWERPAQRGHLEVKSAKLLDLIRGGFGVQLALAELKTHWRRYRADTQESPGLPGGGPAGDRIPDREPGQPAVFSSPRRLGAGSGVFDKPV